MSDRFAANRPKPKRITYWFGIQENYLDDDGTPLQEIDVSKFEGLEDQGVQKVYWFWCRNCISTAFVLSEEDRSRLTGVYKEGDRNYFMCCIA
tara:strand:+ start:103 stop:381 length:279 start_codon:yes stop_codon:yes gene_type:complete